MHDLLRDMGREIVRQLSPQHLGKRSRIWLHEEALDVLKKQMGTETVEGLVLDVRAAGAVPFGTESFTNMMRLQLLQINGVELVGSYERLSKHLIWLCWLECPLKSIPSDFQLDNITILDMQHSNLRKLWREIKSLDKLRILNLSHSKYLARTPNFLGSPNLVSLILEDCPSLIEVHQSIGDLRRLVFLSLKGCRKLRNLPHSICNLESLKTLNLNMCSQLEELPGSLGDMESLNELLVDETAIMTLPSSIGNLKNLIILSLNGCKYRRDTPSSVSWLSKLSSWISPKSSSSKALLPGSFFGLSSLRELHLRDCHLSESEISGADFGSLCSLKRLDLTGNEFFNLPLGIGRLSKLKDLFISNCDNLLSISEMPSSLKEFWALGCKSMERLSLPENRRLQFLFLVYCPNLKEIQGIEAGAITLDFSLEEGNNISDDSKMMLDHGNNISDDSKRMLVQGLGDDYDIVVVGGDVPEWLSYRGEGFSVSFQIPDTASHGELQALVAWIVLSGNKPSAAVPLAETIIKNKTNGNQLLKRGVYINFDRYEKRSWISHMTFAGLPFQIECGDELELYVESGMTNGSYKVERCGVHLIMQKSDTEAVNVADDERQRSIPLGCSEARWRSYLTEELLQPSLHIRSMSSNIHVHYIIEDDRYKWVQKEGESDSYHRVKCSPYYPYKPLN